MSRHPRLLTLAAGGLLLPLTAVAAASTAGSAAPQPGEPAARLVAPDEVTASTFGRDRARVSLPVDIVAGDDPLEVKTNRATYRDEISGVWRSGGPRWHALPDGRTRTFRGLDKFLNIRVTDIETGDRFSQRRRVCLNNWGGRRVRPDAPARSPYPYSCHTNPYAFGMFQGVQAGWRVPLEPRRIRLAPGRYRVRVAITKPFRDALGLSWEDAKEVLRVRVDDGSGDSSDGQLRRTQAADPRPAPHPPSGPETVRRNGPRPNLRSLPAWNISTRRDRLRFNATVWNAGDSPLVVDGFREDGSTEMEAYQYFFNANGDQVGYQHVGQFAYDDHGTHDHWHFKAFARYRLLNADKSAVVRSGKRAFCLANTDAVDLTVEDAAWQPDNTDLHTDCGWEGATSMRQVLASGWGDTYAQFRAGQAFNLEGLPNGWYHIAVEANPGSTLVESDADDNVRLRRVYIGGEPGARTVKVPQVGLVKE